MSQRTRALIMLLLVGCVAAMSMALPSLEVLSSPYAQAEYWLHYDVDYSQVPSWVRLHNLTLKVRVGQAQSVEVIADGQVVSSSYDAPSGWVTFTTDAARIDVRVQSIAAPAGDVQKSALRGDKRWAYSLTFDDGYVDVSYNARPMLDRLGYKGAVAVIGEWLGANSGSVSEGCLPFLSAGRDDALSFGFMDTNLLRALAQAGWGLYNHGYTHNTPESMPGCILENIRACTEALVRVIPGYRTLVYTAYQNRPDLADLAAANQSILGIQIVQAGGGGATQVDSVQWNSPPFRLQRYDVGAPRDGRPGVSGALYYMDETHGKVVGNSSAHYWLSLHGHHVQANDVAGSSLDYLHFMYGPGGTDEVWVAPADEVLQYLATRDFATVRRVGSRSASAGYTPPQVRTVAFRQGWNGYTGMVDTYINAARPSENYNSSGPAGALRVRTPDIEAALLRFDVSSIPSAARVLRATLGFYVLDHSNEGEILISAHTLRKAWNPNQATWEQRAAGNAWNARGANGTTGDDRDRDLEHTDSRSVRWYKFKDDYTGLETLIDNSTWYSLDVTESVRDWVADPAANYGVTLKASGGSTELQIRASEHPDVLLRPCLVITYAEPEVPPAALESQTPTPTATATTTASATPTTTPSSTPTATPSPTSAWTPTPTHTASPTATATTAPSATPTATPVSEPEFRLVLPVVLGSVP